MDRTDTNNRLKIDKSQKEKYSHIYVQEEQENNKAKKKDEHMLVFSVRSSL
jgi:hypothetical protein